jgi:hypothetical protein
MSRFIRRRALLAAALPAALAAFALPSAIALPAAAEAATVSVDSAGTLKFRAGSNEVNSVTIAQDSFGVLIRDNAGKLNASGQCSRRSTVEVLCRFTPTSIRKIDVRLENRNDSISSRTSFETLIDGGIDNDTFFAGMAPGASRVEYRGDAGTDTLNYAGATSGVTMRQDEFANDGRAARGDRDSVRRDVENFVGSRFADLLRGSPNGLAFCAVGCRGSTAFQRFTGGLGDDTIQGGRNSDIHFMGGSPDGADRIHPGQNFTIVDYSGRAATAGVNVSIAQGIRNDGAPGEGDDIFGGVEQLLSGRGNDTLTADPAGVSFVALDGGAGIDTLNGSKGSEVLTGGPGSDTLLAQGGSDTIFANDGEGDTVGCGLGTDTAHLDSRDGFDSCENRPVGVLRLAPKTIAATAGKAANLRMSWRHPQAWRKLRTVELRLYAGRLQVGRVTIRPRNGKIDAAGALELMRKRSKLARSGKTVTARLALRLDESLAGKRLRAEVEATDARGARQVEPDAGRVRVAG